MKNKKVLVAMSGGVDSSVSALLLQRQGYEVVGVTMCFGVKETCDVKARCCGPEAVDDAKVVCLKLGVGHYVFNYTDDLEKTVIHNFVEEYRQGRTPNPCVRCNQLLKFDSLFKKAKALGFDYLATGHYARVDHKDGRYFLKKAKDLSKDQTYFLYPIKYSRLSSVLFPLSHLTKSEVRDIARKAKLPVSEKAESQDICFIADRNYHSFLEKRIGKIPSGEIVHINGQVLGVHKGSCFYTIGQRQGLGISHPTPLYVVAIDPIKNQVVVGDKEDLKSKGLIADQFNLLVDKFPYRARVKIRYGQRSVLADISFRNEKLCVMFDRKQEAVTPGQSVVLYHRNVVIGGGVIRERVV